MSLAIAKPVLSCLISAEQNAAPQECCGLLLGEGGFITAIQPASNIHPTPRTHFEIDPAVLIAAHKTERSGGLQIIGYYHSHPNGLAAPSKTDAAMAAGDGKVWAIIAADKVTFWRDAAGGFSALSYTVIDA